MADYKGLNIAFRADTTEAQKALHIISTEARTAQAVLTGTQGALKDLATNGKALNDSLKALQLDNLSKAMDLAREKADAYRQVLPQLQDRHADLAAQIAQTKDAIEEFSASAANDGSEEAALHISSLKGHLNALEEQERKSADEVERTAANVQISASAANAAANAYATYAQALAASESGLGALGESAQRAGEGFKSVGDAISSVGDKLSIVSGVALMTFGKSIVSSTEEFGNAIAQLGGYLDISRSKLDAMSEQALYWGKETQFSATEAAQAMNELAKGGMTQAQITGGALEATMQLAAAGEMDMASAAEVAVRAINVFGMQASDATQVADALAGAANKSTAEVSSLAQGFAQIGGAASMAGWDMNEVTAALALLADRGFSGAEAGTTLKTTLQRLAAPTDTAKKAMENFGISVYDESGKMVDAMDVLTQFEEKLGGLTEEAQNEALYDIFGARGINGITALLSEGTQGFADYIAATEDAGYAMEMAESRMGDLGWALEYLRGEAETAAVNFGEALVPTITGLAESIEGALGWFNSLSDSQQTLAANIALAVAAAGPALSIAGHLTSTVGGAVEAFGQAASTVAVFRENGGNLANALAQTLIPSMDDAAKRAQLVAEKTAALELTMQNLATGAVVALGTVAIGQLIGYFADYVSHAELVRNATTGITEAVEGADEAMRTWSADGGSANAFKDLADAATASQAALSDVSGYVDDLNGKLSSVGQESHELDVYADTIESLAEKSGITAGEVDLLRDAVDKYNSIAGTSIQVTDDLTGALNVQPDTIDRITDAYRRQVEAQTYMELWRDAIKEQAQVEQDLATATEEFTEIQDKYSVKLGDSGYEISLLIGGALDDYRKLADNKEALEKSNDNLIASIERWKQKAEEAGGAVSSYEQLLKELGITSSDTASGIEADAEDAAGSVADAAAEAEAAIDAAVEAMKRAQEDAYTARQRELEDAYTAQQRAYEAERQALQDALDAEYKQRADAYEAEEQALSDALSAEYDLRKDAFDAAYKQLSDELSKERDAKKAARDKEYSDLKKALSKELSARKDANSKRVKDMRDAHSEAESELSDELDDLYSQRKKAVDKAYKLYQKENDKLLKQAKATYSKQTKEFKKATSERIAAIKAEYEAKKRYVEETDGTKQIDKRIAALNAQTKAEQDAIREQQEAEKTAELQKAVDEAKTRRSRAEAEEALNDYLAELAQEAREREREALIAKLEEEKDAIKKRTEATKDGLDDERDAVIAAYEERRELELEKLQETQDALYEKLSEKLDAQEELRKEKDQAALESYRERLNDRLTALQDANDAEEEKLSEKLAAELERQSEANDLKLEKAKEHNETLATAEAEADAARLARLKASQEAELKQLKASNEAQVAEMASRHETELSNLKAANSAQVDALKQTQTDALTELKRHNQDVLTELKRTQADALDAYEQSLKDANDATEAGGTKVKETTKKKAEETTKAAEDEAKSRNSKVKRLTDQGLADYLAIQNQMPWKTQEIAGRTTRSLADTLASGKTSVNSSATALKDAAENGVSGTPDMMGRTAAKGGREYADGISDARYQAEGAARNLAADVADAANLDLQPTGRESGFSYAEGLSNSSWRVENSAHNVAQDAYWEFNSATYEARSSGYDMGVGFGDGLYNAASYVSSAASYLASLISQYLHHSTPDKGPLHGDDKWGGELAQNIADGMRAKRHVLAEEAAGLAATIQAEMAPATYKTSFDYDVTSAAQLLTQGVNEALRNGGGGGGVTVQVGQLVVREEADIDRISERLYAKMARAERGKL